MRTGVLRAIEDRNPAASRSGEESLSRRDRTMSVDAAGIGIARVELVGRVRPTAIDELVEIDRKQGRTRTTKVSRRQPE